MSGELSVKKPVKVWNKKLQTNFKDLFKSLGKAAINGGLGNWSGVGASMVDASAALGLQDEPGEIAWRLIYKSLVRAMFALAESNQDLLLVNQRDDRTLEELCGQLDLSLEDRDLSLSSDFLLRPKELPILERIKIPFVQWLEEFGLEPAEASSIANRLPSYFVFGLDEEWGSRPTDYARLQEIFKTPFAKASDRARRWQRYSAWLQKQVDEPMFVEPFSLKQVYVPLRAYYEKRKSEKEPEQKFPGRSARLSADAQYDRVVVDLLEAIESWLEKGDRNDAIRVISGGPGSGKSSFAKILAARQAEIGTIPVLFVPLHQFDPADDLVDAIGKWVRDDWDGVLPENPLGRDNHESRLLIVFDGLDELAKAGKIGAEIARDFLREVEKKIDRFNQSETRLQVLISGRELAIQDNASDLRKKEQIFHVLPYFIPEQDRKKYLDSENLLARDDRQQWWANYGKASGRGYTAMPSELDLENLLEITTQPLLNYLLALSFVRGKMQLSEDSNLNSIYKDLLEAVYERGWARASDRQNPQHRSLEGVKEKDFIRILEEIALASWHGDGRTTTVKEIAKHCDDLKDILELFQEEAKAGVTRLLTAFYFRESSYDNKSEKTFEFTHKSFGEYLTAKRIMRAVRRIHNKLEHQQDPEDIWNEEKALTYWATLCGASAIDNYLFDFILAEVRLQDISEVEKWQQDFCRLIGYMLSDGMPMQCLDPRPAYREESRQARNAEEALLAVLNACARATQKLSEIDWPEQTAFGAWIGRLQGQRTSPKNVLALQCLSFLDLSGCTLLLRDLYGANLNGANLNGAHFHGDNMIMKDSIKATKIPNFNGASIAGAGFYSDGIIYSVDFNEENLHQGNIVDDILDQVSINKVSIIEIIIYEESLD